MSAIHQLSARLDALLKQGAANVRRGLPGVLGSGALGQEFDHTYTQWMTLRARYGDPFALSLGYGKEIPG